MIERDHPHVLMVSSYPPSTDGIASYTSRLVRALHLERLALVTLARKEQEWKPNSLTYIVAILRRAICTNVDIVHIQTSYFMFGNEYYTALLPILILGLRLFRKICIVTVHDVVPRQNLTIDFLKNYTREHYLALKRLAFIAYTSLVCNLSNMVVVHQEIASDVLVMQYYTPKTKIKVIPHGINGKCPGLEKENDGLMVAYFGLIRHGKGLEDLIKAWSIVRGKLDALLQIIGGKHPYLEDDCYEKLVRLIKKLELNSSVVFRGFVPSKELPKYFANTDVFVFPYNEWGDVIASSGALSMVVPFRKPMVATDIPAFDILKRSKTAYIVSRGDIYSLSNAIIRALTDIQMNNRLIKRIDELLLQSNWSSVARKTSLLYRSLLHYTEMIH